MRDFQNVLSMYVVVSIAALFMMPGFAAQETSYVPVPFFLDRSIIISVPGDTCICSHHKESIDTIQDALDCLDNVVISPEATVTIKMTQQPQETEYYETISVNHPDGNKIKIVGSCDSGKVCTLHFKGVAGVSLSNGNFLGWLDNFTFLGNHAEGAHGITVTQKSGLICGEHITVQQFDHGIYASGHSYITAPYVRSTNNSRNGIDALDGSTIQAPNATLDHNGECGAHTWGGSNIDVTNACARHNTERGIFSDGNSIITASNAVSEYNGYEGIRASQEASVEMAGGQANKNCVNYNVTTCGQFAAEVNGLIFAPNATSTTIGEGAYHVAFGGRVCGVNDGPERWECYPP